MHAKRLVSIMFVAMVAMLLTIDGALSTSDKLTDDQCKAELKEYFDEIEIPSEVEKLVDFARLFYKDDSPIEWSNYAVNEMCTQLDDKVFDIEEIFNCSDRLLGPENKYKTLVNLSDKSKNVMEAVYACKDGSYSMEQMIENGVGDVFIDRAANEIPLAEKQSLIKAFAKQTKKQSLVEASAKKTAKQCLDELAEYFDEIQITSEVKEQVNYARLYYKKYPSGSFGNGDCEGCVIIKQSVWSIEKNIVCSEDVFDARTKKQTLVNISYKSRDVMEAYYACMNGAYAMNQMIQDGVQDAFKDRALDDGSSTPTISYHVQLSDHQCKTELTKYFDSIKIPRKAKQQVDFARQSYKKNTSHEWGDHGDSAECDQITDKISEIEERFKCSDSLLGPRNFHKTLVKISRKSKDVMEAYYACLNGSFAMEQMVQDGVQDVFIGRATNKNSLTNKLKKARE